ncbi:MAG: TolC family protein, partial [Pirellulaceae bacterium]|nr:TolC family protein [Pirellulaceae bacterium]
MSRFNFCRCHRSADRASIASPLAVRARRAILASLVAMTAGCGVLEKITPTPIESTPSYHDNHGLRIEYPQVHAAATEPAVQAVAASEPLVLQDPSELPTMELTLQEAVQLAVQQSPVLRTIGGTVVTAPQATQTIYDPALTSASPQLGTEAALAAFDAQYTQQLFWNKVDTPNNVNPADLSDPILSQFLRGANRATQGSFTGEISKQTAQGASFALRHVVNYDRNNFPNRFFKSDFIGWVEAEWRQPLMQGAGTTYNRIAGPTTVPGQYNGVL